MSNKHYNVKTAYAISCDHYPSEGIFSSLKKARKALDSKEPEVRTWGLEGDCWGRAVSFPIYYHFQVEEYAPGKLYLEEISPCFGVKVMVKGMEDFCFWVEDLEVIKKLFPTFHPSTPEYWHKEF